MRTHIRRIVLTVALTVFAAACGDGGSGGTPVVTPTTTPTPRPTTTIDEPCGEGVLKLTVRSLPGSDLDVGWSGIWHNSLATHDNLVHACLICADDDCTIDGSGLVGRGFGAPLPLSAGGVSACVLTSFREAVTGIYRSGSGCAEVSVKLSSRVFLAPDADMPCPPCVGDPTPNDGVRDGTCRGGTTPGAACDVGGISDLFQNADGVGSDFGMLSNDCLPAGSSVGDLDIDVSPLTTGTVTVDASIDCRSGAFAPGSCFCPGQVQPNACEPDGVCPVTGVCELGPIDSVCLGQPFRRCRSGTGTEDCDARFPGAGGCVDQPRPCFGSQVARTGTCGTEQSSLVSFFCIPATGADAIDSMVGLPGPGAITLPVRHVRTPR